MVADNSTRAIPYYELQRAFPAALAQHIERKRVRHDAAYEALGDLNRQVVDGFYRKGWLKRLRAKWFFGFVRNAISEASRYVLSRQKDLEEDAKLKPFGIGLYQSEVVYWCRNDDFDGPKAISALLDADDAVGWTTELEQIYQPLVNKAMFDLRNEVKYPQIVAWAVETAQSGELWLTLCWTKNGLGSYSYRRVCIDTMMQQAA